MRDTSLGIIANFEIYVSPLNLPSYRRSVLAFE